MATTSTMKNQGQSNFEQAREAAGTAADKAREGMTGVAEKAREAVGVAADKARESFSALGQSASSMASAAVNKADEAVSSAGKRLETWGEGVRENTPHEGLLGAASDRLAGALETSGNYLEDHGLTGMVEDVTEMIKRNPIPALFIGIGIGFLIAKATSSRS